MPFLVHIMYVEIDRALIGSYFSSSPRSYRNRESAFKSGLFPRDYVQLEVDGNNRATGKNSRDEPIPNGR